MLPLDLLLKLGKKPPVNHTIIYQDCGVLGERELECHYDVEWNYGYPVVDVREVFLVIRHTIVNASRVSVVDFVNKQHFATIIEDEIEDEHKEYPSSDERHGV